MSNVIDNMYPSDGLIDQRLHDGIANGRKSMRRNNIARSAILAACAAVGAYTVGTAVSNMQRKDAQIHRALIDNAPIEYVCDRSSILSHQNAPHGADMNRMYVDRVMKLNEARGNPINPRTYEPEHGHCYWAPEISRQAR